MCIYESSAEEVEIYRIVQHFPKAEILNPGSYDKHPEKRRDTLAFCYGLIDKSDLIIFTRLLGKITSGVGAEVNYALKLGKPVYELKGKGLRSTKRPVQYLSRPETA